MEILTNSYSENVARMNTLLGVGRSCDMVSRDFLIAGRRARIWVVDGYGRDAILERMGAFWLSLGPEALTGMTGMKEFADRYITFSETNVTEDTVAITTSVLLGKTLLLVEGLGGGALMDAKNYPSRGVEEPTDGKVLRGSHDGFVEAVVPNMGTYRSPAVALMPDVTPKPLRSRANAVINLMGAAGGITYLLLAKVLYPDKSAAAVHVDYFRLFAVVAAIMCAAAAVVALTVRERKLDEEMHAWEIAHPQENLAVDDGSGGETLPPAVRRSLGFLLASIALWFIGYNAVETWFTTYANRVWGMPLGSAAVCLTAATAGAIASYLPVGALASRIGRRRTILGGILLLAGCFFSAFLVSLATDRFQPGLYVLFALVGAAWAAISVNSLPMTPFGFPVQDSAIPRFCIVSSVYPNQFQKTTGFLLSLQFVFNLTGEERSRRVLRCGARREKRPASFRPGALPAAAPRGRGSAAAAGRSRARPA